MDQVVGRSLLGAVGLAEAFLDEILEVATRDETALPWEVLAKVRAAIQQFEPLLAEHLSDAVLAGWVEGYDNVANNFPAWLAEEFRTSIRQGPPDEPPGISIFTMFEREPELRLINTQNAAKRLMERKILTREQFDAAKEDAQRQAFTIAGDLGGDTIERMRYLLAEDMAQGTSLAGFRNRIEETLGTSPIGPGHLENVYRTNLQAAFRDGRETLRNHPFVAATFPYQAYIATHDQRTRDDHRILETLGLDGTNIYRADDPVWDYVTPPWDYNCRCGVRLLTLDQAAARGVREAKEWLESGRPPFQPTYRADAVLRRIETNPGFGSRGNVGVIVMSAARAPSGYSKAEPLKINGKEYTGGMFIPSDELKHATKAQKKEIKAGKKSPQMTLDFDAPEPATDVPSPSKEPPANWVRKIAQSHRMKLGSGFGAKIGFDTKAKSRGWWMRLLGPDGRTDFPKRFTTSAEAAREVAGYLHARHVEAEPAPRNRQRSQDEPAKPRTPRPRKEAKTNQGNWQYSSTDFFARGAKAKFRDNLDALRVLKTLEIEGREASDAEKETLSKYVGWGQFPQAFNRYQKQPGSRYTSYNSDYDKWAKERDELLDLVGEDAFNSAARSTINSHFTHPEVIQAHWKMAERLGFKGGKMLEPAVGGGYYMGFMPEDIAKKTNVTAVEMDDVSGRISQALYPSANVHIKPFQRHATPDNFYDMVATNVPFSGDIRISDPKYKSMKPTLHDYYFLRSVDTAKPGGLVMHLTSAGTMDKLDDRVRKYIDEHCELVSAVRFPGDAHKENAGTEVVTDMLVLRKKNPTIPDATEDTPREADPKQPGFTGTTVDSLGRLYHWVDGVRVPAPRWDDTVQVPDPDGGDPITINRYFAEHPEQMLGRLDRSGTMYSGGMKNVVRTEDYDERLQAVIDRLPEAILRTGNQSAEEPEDTRIAVEPGRNIKEGLIIAQGGTLFRHSNGALEELKFDPRIEGQVRIRDAARDLLAAQQAGVDTEAERKRLNELYDEFVAEYGPLNSRTNRNAMKLDVDAPFVLSLEHYNSTTQDAFKADIFSKDTVSPDSVPDKAGSLGEAVGITLHATGGIDVERIAKLTDRTADEVEYELMSSGLAYEDPAAGWQSASEYLSGNTRKKLAEARAAAAADPKYEPNVAALEASQPTDIPSEDIGIKLGSPWVPTDVIEEFCAHTLGARADQFKVRHVAELQHWELDVDNSLRWRSSNTEVWSVKDDSGEIKAGFAEVLKAALTGKDIVIRSATSDENGVRRVLAEETQAAREKVDELKQQFKDWVWDDDERSERLNALYNETQNNYVPRRFDGSHLQFPGMRTTGWPLRDIQKDFVWRVVSTGKGFAGHEVGTGKTASMIASAMELRRLKLAKKPAIACLKSNIEQITAEALELYPNAKILSTANMFDANRRQQTLNSIATGDYDMIILTHEHVQAMKMKPENTAKFMQQEIEELQDAILAAAQEKDGKIGNRVVKRLETQKQKLEEQLRKALSEDTKDSIFFEDSGIDMLMVDEAHHFKSLPCNSRRGEIKGVPSGNRSNRATDMLQKTQYLLEQNNGRGVVFATGTPVVNTMAELYVMQRFLQPELLKERGLHRFDAWADTYGETQNNFEFKLNGEVKPTVRFSKFVNMPELRHLTSEFMDIQRVDNLRKPNGKPVIQRPNRKDNVTVSASNPAIESMMADIYSRAEALKGKRPGGKGDDNMLSVCNDAKLGSIDMRLVDGDAEDHPDSKANQAVRKIVDIYKSQPGKTQAVFSDMGINPTKATGFSLFEDMKRKLVAAGIPASEIVDFSEDSMKNQKRQEAQDAMKRGDKRIAFGSTKRLGTGTNIQKNLYAVHHLDIPYVPAALEQRDGRGYRSGNQNEDFHVHKYVQQGSADPLFWQILANKSGFINQYMLGNTSARTMEDINAEQLSPDEMISVASGDSGMLERIALEQDVRQLTRARMRHSGDQTRIRKALEDADNRRAELKQMQERRRQDQLHLKENSDFRMDIGGRAITERKDAAPVVQEAIEAAKTKIASQPRYMRKPHKIGSYRGMDVAVRPNGMLQLTGPSGEEYETGASIQSLDYAARNMAKRVEEAKQAAADYETDLGKMQQQLGAFRKQAELEDKQRQLAELKAAKATKLSLQPGTTKTVGGVTYTLNQNHRWTVAKPTGGQQQPKVPAQTAQNAPQQAAAPQQGSGQPQPPSPQTLALAGSDGDSPEHRQARHAVAMHYLQNVAQYYDYQNNRMAPLDAGRISGMLDGIDLSKPVTFGPPPQIPPPERLVQWQAPGGYRGSYFALEGAKPEDLGIHREAKAWSEPGQPVRPREQKLYSTKKAKITKVSYLRSVAAPTVDTWSVPGTKIPVAGGAQQFFIPVAAHPAVRVPVDARAQGRVTNDTAANQQVPTG